MNLQQLRFVQEAVRRQLNLTEAAKALHTSQPGVSKAIIELEEELDEELDTEEETDSETEPAAAKVSGRQPSNLPEGFDPRPLIAKFIPIVNQIAGGFQRKLPRNVLRDDLIAAGMSGLWDAVRRHGHEQSENFDWYVRVRIRGAILDELRAQDWLPRRARAAATEAAASGNTRTVSPSVVRFDEVSETEQARCLIAPDSTNTEKMVETLFIRARLGKALEQLPEREQKIVAMHYFRGVKFKDLGEMLGVSEPRISQLHSRAMSRLKIILDDAA